MNKAEIKWLAHGALLFNLSPKFRMISLEIEKGLKALVVTTEELNEEEKDLFYSFVGEIEGHFDEIINIDTEILVDGKTSIDDLPRLSILVHAFYE